MKKLLKKLNKEQQDYYNFLAHECFAALSNAEDNFKINRFASCATSLFHSAEFFWKSLTILSGKYFETKHEPSQHDMAQISGDLLTSQEKTKAYEILTKFPKIRRTLATYGYYEKGKTTEPPSKVFNRQDTQADLNDVRWMVNKFREIHFSQVFEPPVRVAVLSGYVENTSNGKELGTLQEVFDECTTNGIVVLYLGHDVQSQEEEILENILSSIRQGND